MDNSVSVRAERLVVSLKRRRVAAISIPLVLLSLAVIVPAAIYSLAVSERNERIKDDYQATWCETFGSGKYTLESVEEWREFVDRNRESLEENPMLMYTDGLTGRQYLGFEVELDFIGEYIYYPESSVEYVGSTFSILHDEFARGQNEFGKAVPLPCN